MTAPADFGSWCILYGCRYSLYIGSLDFQHHRVPWNAWQQWNGSDLAGTFLAEFGYIGTGNPAALPKGADPGLLSKGTTASNHETGQMAQQTLQRLLGPAAFGLPPDYRFTLADGQRAVVLEDPKTPGVCLWDGVIARMLAEKAPQKPPAPPGGPIVKPPVVTPPQPPPTPPATIQGLPPLTPSAARIVELDAIAAKVLYEELSAPWDKLPWATMLAALHPLTVRLLRAWRRSRRFLGDPRAIPPEDLG